MSGDAPPPPLEVFLAQLYTDPELRARFLQDPAGVTQEARLSERDCTALLQLDRTGLQLAARSFAHKRRAKTARAPRSAAGFWRTHWRRWIARWRSWRFR